ncbi:MAG: NAD(P)-dependent glycerol-3-phosphate dehydrogenase [Spirochaetales bacterium]|uniref:Glycerol-3-phosphate dehydrogenase [NAD(P)+] n=1 Tax=Candidatus Thalassospirochaeta sargassi TaxID=3119039 RepID=A0AAJ1IC53_9SPIO|nr:NAD(P)-dependent glycerol-3-phosphate dehydrogenase [Spirochaetales bacterium]
MEQNIKNIGIINAGAWGTAIAKVLGASGHNVEIWEYMEDVVAEINTEHSNSRYLLGVNLSENVTATGNLTKAATGKDFIIIATPSLYILDIVKKLVPVQDIMEGKPVIGILTKGFIKGPAGPVLITRALEDYLPGFYKDGLVYISGPSHAEEVARGKLTGLISASKNGLNSIRFRELLSGSNLMVYSSLDTIGVQTCGAVKNVIAIAYGMLDALSEITDSFGDNTESLLLAAGLNEIQQIGKALGSEYPETFTSIAGVGDLDVTCRSKYGRNRKFGREIVNNRKIAGFKDAEDLIANIDRIGYLPEGAIAASYVKQLMEQYKLKLPVSEVVYKILNKEDKPLKAIHALVQKLNIPQS